MPKVRVKTQLFFIDLFNVASVKIYSFLCRLIARYLSFISTTRVKFYLDQKALALSNKPDIFVWGRKSEFRNQKRSENNTLKRA